MPGRTRREVLALAAGTAASAAFAPRWWPSAGTGSSSPSPSPSPGEPAGAATSAETPLEVLTTYFTPNDRFFVRHWNPVPVDPARWTLTIGGDVARPRVWTAAELARLPQTRAVCVLQCAGSGRSHFRRAPGVPWGDGAVGNAEWSGVSLRHLLEASEPAASTRHLHVFGPASRAARVEPFARSLPLEKALDDALIALAMNGAPLPEAHGGPARLVVPRWTGQHWMKWVLRLEARGAPLENEYMDRAYRVPAGSRLEVVAELPVKSVITRAPSSARNGETVSLAGFAYSGAAEIARVEISDDDGTTWSAARLEREHAPAGWRLWSAARELRGAGRRVIFARATDGAGRTQPRDVEWNPGGYLYNGWHSVVVNVS